MMRLLHMMFALTITLPAAAEAAGCDRVLSYFRSDSSTVEWRVLDPFTGVDTLMRRVSEPPQALMWDSTLARVRFTVADTVYQAGWRPGAPAHAICRLPVNLAINEYSFDTAANEWRVSTWETPALPAPGADSLPLRCWRERWASRDGFAWHRVSRDSFVCFSDDMDYPEHDQYVGSDMPFIRTDALSPEMVESSGTQVDPDSGGIHMLVPLVGAPGRGILSIHQVRAPELDCVGSPFWWVDSRTGTRRLVMGNPDTPACGSACERCGLVLLTSGIESRLIDATSGAEFLALPQTDEPAIWAPRPAPR